MMEKILHYLKILLYLFDKIGILYNMWLDFFFICFVCSHGFWYSHNTMESGHHWILTHLNTHYNGVIMSAIASQITSLTILYSIVFQGADQRNISGRCHWPLWGEINGDRWTVRHKRPVKREMFPFDDVIMLTGKTEYSINSLAPKQHGQL